jgi:hypothetical protein
MFSWTHGIPIARVDGGNYNKRILKLDLENKSAPIKITDPLSFFRTPKIKNLLKSVTLPNMYKLEKAISRNKEPDDPYLADLYNKIMNILVELEKYEIKLDNGKFVPLPTFKNEENESQRIYVAGPTGSGKSTYCATFMKELKKITRHRNKPIYIFSQIKKDDVLDKLNPIRIRLDEELLEKEIELKELENSIVLFDDIKTIPNKKIRDCVDNLKDRVLSEGRHHNIICICTNHQICDSKTTKSCLLECSDITFFPASGGINGITRFLSSYIGMTRKEINEVLRLPSRWVTVHKQFPMYILYETGCYFVNSLSKLDCVSNAVKELEPAKIKETRDKLYENYKYEKNKIFKKNENENSFKELTNSSDSDTESESDYSSDSSSYDTDS